MGWVSPLDGRRKHLSSGYLQLGGHAGGAASARFKTMDCQRLAAATRVAKRAGDIRRVLTNERYLIGALLLEQQEARNGRSE